MVALKEAEERLCKALASDTAPEQPEGRRRQHRGGRRETLEHMDMGVVRRNSAYYPRTLAYTLLLRFRPTAYPSGFSCVAQDVGPAYPVFG